jgi:hypothetical protein
MGLIAHRVSRQMANSQAIAQTTAPIHPKVAAVTMNKPTISDHISNAPMASPAMRGTGVEVAVGALPPAHIRRLFGKAQFGAAGVKAFEPPSNPHGVQEPLGLRKRPQHNYLIMRTFRWQEWRDSNPQPPVLEFYCSYC